MNETFDSLFSVGIFLVFDSILNFLIKRWNQLRVLAVLLNETLKLTLINHLHYLFLNTRVFIRVSQLGQKSTLISEQLRNVNFGDAPGRLELLRWIPLISDPLNIIPIGLIPCNIRAKKGRVDSHVSAGQKRASTVIERIVILLIIYPILKVVKVAPIGKTGLLLNGLVLGKGLLLFKKRNFSGVNFGQRKGIGILQSALVLENVILVSTVLSVGAHPVSLESVLTLLVSDVQRVELSQGVVPPVVKIIPERIPHFYRLEDVPDLPIKHNDY